MTPVVCIVGKSNTGKTTLIEKLLKEIKKRNYKVATIKHDTHGFEMDKPGKDTWRHAKAGADCVTISSPNRVAMIKKVQVEWTLDELILLNKDADLIVVEGFKTSNKPKIEVIRSERSSKSICDPKELIAIASDIDPRIPGVPLCDINDALSLVNIIEEKIICREKV